MQQNKEELQPAPVILRMKQMRLRVGLGRSSIYAMMNPNSRYYDPSYPRPIRISAKAVGWLESEITDWIATRASARASKLTNPSQGN